MTGFGQSANLPPKNCNDNPAKVSVCKQVCPFYNGNGHGKGRRAKEVLAEGMNDREIEMIRYIQDVGKTHYADLAEHMNLSQRTIANYLDQIEHDIRQTGVRLVRKPNDGIYFSGNSAGLQALLHQPGGAQPQSHSERRRYMLSKLLLSSRAYTLQQFADELFVSRSTIENDLKGVKSWLQSNGIPIKISRGGISLEGDERRRRHAAVRLISRYWGKEMVAEHADGRLIRTIKLPPKIGELFKPQIIDRVLSSLAEFVRTSRLEFSDYEFQSLAIHLMIVFERMTAGTFDERPTASPELIPETRQLVAILEKEFAMTIPQQEQNYINLHIIAVTHESVSANDVALRPRKQKAVPSVAAFLKKQLVDLKPDKELLAGLGLHLSSAIKRLKIGLAIYNPYTDEIRRNFPQAFDQAVMLKKVIQDGYHVALNDDETAYIALHFESFLERHIGDHRLTAVVVCSSGIGTSQLLAQRLEHAFDRSLRITRVVSLSELVDAPLSEDLVISTIPISDLSKPVVVVSPLFVKADVHVLDREISELMKQSDGRNPFFSLIHRDLIFLDRTVDDYRQVIAAIGDELARRDLVTDRDQVIQAAAKREQLASTALGKVALPHVAPELIRRPFIAVWVNPERINWIHSEPVQLVFFLGLNRSVQPYLREIYTVLNRLIDDQTLIHRIVTARSISEIVALLNRRDT
jgi:transcriptional antiterminator